MQKPFAVFALSLCLIGSACKERTEEASQEEAFWSQGGFQIGETHLVCLGNRDFKKEFNFDKRTFDVKNAYWLGQIATTAYQTPSGALSTAQKLGFSEDDGKTHINGENHIHFLDVDESKRLDLLKGSSFLSQSQYNKLDTQGLWLENEKAAFVTFRGTEITHIYDVLTDFRLQYLDTKLGYVHEGFFHALGIVWDSFYYHLQNLRKREYAKKAAVLDGIASKDAEGRKAALTSLTNWKDDLNKKTLFMDQWLAISPKDADADFKRRSLLNSTKRSWRYGQKPVWIVGHSMGGALASIAAGQALYNDFSVAGIYRYGPARPGNEKYRDAVMALAKRDGIDDNVVNFVNYLDAVPRMPPIAGILDNSWTRDPWSHYGHMKYFTEVEPGTGTVQLIQEDAWYMQLPQFTRQLPILKIKEWTRNHNPTLYTRKLENLAYGSEAPCD